MRIITGYIPASSGRVSIDGTWVGTDNPGLRRKIGYLPENNPLYPDMYVAEYLSFVASLYMPRNMRAKAVGDIIETTGLTAERKKKIGELSKGYRQRVGLAQALIHNPRVLILDEATAGLDPNQLAAIRTLISETGKEKTVMLSTHIMQEVEAICSNIIIIDKGRIIANGTRAEILRMKDSSAGTVIAEFDGRPDPANLMVISGVRNVSMQGDKEYVIEARDGTDIRAAIFAWAVANSLTVLSLHRKESSLEEVFRYITAGPAE